VLEAVVALGDMVDFENLDIGHHEHDPGVGVDSMQ
jgi:hypothetical protein